MGKSNHVADFLILIKKTKNIKSEKLRKMKSKQ